MAARLAHRGPDEEGEFLSDDGRCAIGFRRLSVIDPVSSHQPMSSPDGGTTVAFNGEIYNFQSLRQQLSRQGAEFRTAGDTEVLLHLYRSFDLQMLDHLEGMFAFALYDAVRGRLLLARDRLGQKPLWYALLEDRIVFTSEAKALLIHPLIGRQMDEAAITSYCTIGYIPAPASAWKAIRKVPPAHRIVVDEDFACQRYWEPAIAAITRLQPEAQEVVRETVSETVKSLMVADVPLGALLSGGIDSSIVAAIMARAAGRAGGVRTFTAGFEDADYDERPAARIVADHCRTEHTELLVSIKADGLVDAIVDLYDEPFGDSSALPTWQICRATRQYVTVALVGDGGDEVFAGYDRYRALWAAGRMAPAGFLLSRLLATVLGPFAAHDERNRARRFVRFTDCLTEPFARQYFNYRSLFTPQDLPRLFTEEFASRVDLDGPFQWFCDLYEEGNLEEEVQRAQRHDMLTYLPDDLLVKTDIASMASSLELRAPLLERRVVDLGLSLPTELKLNWRRGKAILRQAFKDMLPRETLSRPKRGFAVPLDKWLRGELLQDLRETLLDGALYRHGIFRREAIAGLINDHFARRGDHRHRLWALLVLAKWLSRQG